MKTKIEKYFVIIKPDGSIDGSPHPSREDALVAMSKLPVDGLARTIVERFHILEVAE